MQRYLAMAALLALAACGTPQQQCISAVTHDLTVVDKLIVETQTNIDRGYAYITVPGTITRFVDCTPKPTVKHPNPRPRRCLEEVAHTYSRAVAIDLNARGRHTRQPQGQARGTGRRRAAKRRGLSAAVPGITPRLRASV